MTTLRVYQDRENRSIAKRVIRGDKGLSGVTYNPIAGRCSSGAHTGNALVLNTRNQRLHQHFYFGVCFLGVCLAFWQPIKQMITFSLTRDYGAHIILILPVSVCLICMDNNGIFSDARVDIIGGSTLIVITLALSLAAYSYLRLSPYYLSVEIVVLVSLWISGFVLFYGITAFHSARFPLLFLLLLVPFPEFLVDKLVYFLQAGSAALAFGLLRLVDTPVFKEGFVLRFPAIDIQVASECSGIRSSLALLITTLCLAKFGLRSFWSKSILLLAVLPMVIVKNAARIATISLITVYVDHAFVHGWMHVFGGVLFYVLGLLALFTLATFLRRSEKGLSPGASRGRQSG